MTTVTQIKVTPSMNVHSVPGGHCATNFTDFILLALLDNLIRQSSS